ncbi:porin family protein [Flavobacterium agricola]|uniref:Porin family protein n=1 Tax=Flavobacterium agricola TaxID=2870839 RepID=A0ABY6LXS1_9FLAO|nr:porin family protein [Flavobacterium agricola]UYW01106.1 porin family protein [Flavobacterium agricola]
MVKKTIQALGVVAILLTSSATKAQTKFKVGIDAGYTHTTLHADVSGLVDSKYTGRGGFGTNISAEMNVWKTLFVSSGVSFIQRNYKFERTNSRQGWYTKFDNEFLSVPVLVGGYLINNPYETDGIWLKVAGGVYGEYWLSQKRDGQYPVFSELQPDGSYNYTQVSEKYDFKKNENELERFAFGLQGQAQLGYALKTFDVYLGYNYLYGLTDSNKYRISGSKKTTRDSHMLTLGVGYKF